MSTSHTQQALRTLFITGGSRGIGASLAELAGASGYKVILSYNKQSDNAEAVVARIRKAGGEAHYLQLDVSDSDQVVKCFAEIYDKFGPLDALVNNAGIVDLATRIENIGPLRLQRMFAINVFGNFYCCQQAVKHMSTQYGGKGGVIVNVSSIASRIGGANEYVDYAASKAAVDTLTLGLAKEVAEENIRVVCVRPGTIDTDIHADSGDRDRPQKIKQSIPLKRPGFAQEIAETILWCLSDKASYITGTCIDVSGGR